MSGYDFDAIRRDYPLQEVVGKSVQLKKAGRLWQGCCPFHSEKTPSFTLYPDYFHCFGCWKRGDVIDFVALIEKTDISGAITSLTGGTTVKLTAEDIERRKQEREAQERELQARQEAATLQARQRWDAAIPVNGGTHPYLERKGIPPYGARKEGENLLLPVYGADGEIQTVQLIPSQSNDKKLFHAGAPASGGRYAIGEPTDEIVICEGYATGVTVQLATGKQVIIAYSKANILRIAQEYSQGAAIILAGEIGAEDEYQAMALAVEAGVVFPDMQGAEGTDFNDQAGHYGLADVAASFSSPVTAPSKERPIRATPFSIRPEAEIPARQWLYGWHLLRKYVSVDVAAGGIGKSALKIGEAVAMASGRQLYRPEIHNGPLKVWLFNLEDPIEEIERRVHATAKRHDIPLTALLGNLWWDSGRDQKLVIATRSATGVTIVRPVVEAIVEIIKELGIDVMSVDPFVSSHEVSENDNGEIDIVVKQWAAIAHEADCSINLVHHIRKANGQEATAESSRGAVSLIAGARSVMVYNRMNKDEAAQLGIAEEERKFFFRIENDKANLAPTSVASWHRMNNVDLDNGDKVGVACAWEPPDPFQGITTSHLMRIQKEIAAGAWRENIQSSAWVGIPIATVLGLDHGDQKDRARIKALIKTWLKEGVLEKVEVLDERRVSRPGIAVGRWVSE